MHTREGDPDPAPLSARRIRLAFAAVTGLAPLVVIPGLFDFANLPQSSFLQVGTAALLAWVLSAPAWRLRPGRPEWPPLTAVLAAFIAWSALSCTWAPNPALSVRLWIHWLAAAIAYALLFHLSDRAADLRPVFAAALAAGALVAALGVGQRAWGWTFVPQAFPPAATFANKNVAAQFAAAVLPFALVFLTGARRRTSMAVAAVAMLLLSFVALTRTRSAALAVVAESLVLMVWWGRSRRWAWALGAMAAAVVLAIVIQHQWSSPESASTRSVAARLAIWRNTLVMVREHPLGVGLGAFPALYPAYHRRAVVDPLFSSRVQLDFAHDDYLQLLAELGIAGAALLAALLLGALALVREARRRAGTGPEAMLAAAATASVAGLLTDALFSFPVYRAMPPWLLAVDAATLALLARGAAPARGFLVSRPAWRVWLAAAAAVSGAVLIVAQSRWLRADAHVAVARRAEAAGDWPRVADAAGAAAALDPARADAWFALGTAALVADRPTEAVKALHQATAREPFNPNALANLGFARAKAGDRSGAADALRRAVDISPGEGEAAYQLGVLLQETGDAAGALEAFRKAAQAWPTDPRPQFRRGLLALRARQFAEAEEALRAAVSLDPGSAGAHKALGVVLLEGGRRVEAAARFQEAIRLDAAITDRPMMEQVIADVARGPVRSLR